MTRPTVVLELGQDCQLARDLSAGGVFVPTCELELDVDCDLLLRGAGSELRVPARVVWHAPGRGAGLQLLGCDAQLRAQIAALGAAAAAAASPAAAPATAPAAAEPAPAPAEPISSEDPAAPADAPAAEGEAVTLSFDDAFGPDHAEPHAADEVPEAATAGRAGRTTRASENPLNVHERLRGMTLAEQLKLAHHGEVNERIVLERMYGKNVWEALLRNPRLTGPEVARIARMGALPRPLIELIVANGGWLQIGEVRRALLSNPRLGTDQILRVLRLLPKHELKLAASQTVYPHAVRDAAKRLIKEAGG